MTVHASIAQTSEPTEPQARQLVLDRPDEVRAWVSLAAALRRERKLDEALAASQRAVELNPADHDALHILGWNLVDLGRVREAQGVAARALSLFPQSALLYWLRAFVLLLLGDYPQGWADYESRWHIPGLGHGHHDFPRPQWRGENLAGRTIFLHPEQGIGDTIQFSRYVPLLHQHGPKKILLATPPELQSLFARSFPGVELVRDGQAIPAFDVHCPLMSLPFAFGTTLATVPAQTPYLLPDPSDTGRWRQRLSTYPGLKVGLVWAGGPRSVQNVTRSMHLSKMQPLNGVPGVSLVSLQKGEPAAQVAQVPQLNLVDWTAELNTFDDTAALVSALDLVISVCTSVTHLSGALGRPTWTLLAFAADFRWMLERADTPWYPTMRLLRQPAPGDWDSVIARICAELITQIQSK